MTSKYFDVVASLEFGNPKRLTRGKNVSIYSHEISSFHNADVNCKNVGNLRKVSGWIQVRLVFLSRFSK